MTPLGIIQIIIGIPLALFITGYLIARIFFKELTELEKIALGFVLSIAVDIIVGLFLGYNEAMKNLTGGITALNLWIYLGAITIILLIIWIIKNRQEYHNTIGWIGKLFEKEEKKTTTQLKNIPAKKKTSTKKDKEDILGIRFKK